MADLDKAEEALKKALQQNKLSVDDTVIEYLTQVCGTILQDADGSDLAAVQEELLEALEPQLEESNADEKQLKSIAKAMTEGAFGAPAKGGNSTSSTNGAKGAEDDVLCKIPDLILMYGGSATALLKGTSLELKRNHRYGIVGQNGAGKTTLFQALLSGAVKELSSKLKIEHVSGASANEPHEQDTPAVEYATKRQNELGEAAKAVGTVQDALTAVGFDKEMQGKTLRELSGGWRMRLALACVMMKQGDVLLLDEPTNHLDAAAVDWLGKFCSGLKGTCLIISHEPDFLDAVCTDIIHFDQQKLKYYDGNFSSFVKKAALDDDGAAAVLETKTSGGKTSMNTAAGAIRGHQEEIRLTFPNPGVLEKSKPILEAKDISFKYTDDGKTILDHLTLKLTQNSRVAVVGANGAGKSTLLSVMCGENGATELPDGTIGEIVRNPNLRLSYIAQQHTFHLEEFLKCTPIQYFQIRFRNGYDEMLQRRLIDPANEEEKQQRQELAAKYGKYGKQVRDIVGRQKRGKDVVYEVAWEGLDDVKQNTWETLSKLKTMKVDSFARAFDERHAAQQTGTDQRPLTDREIKAHLEDFTFSEDMVKREINKFSGGQRCRLMLAAAFWTKPHIIALDEPTNYLDPETVNSLARALRNFKGGVITVTHSEHFINEVCNESWLLKDGKITSSKISKTKSESSAAKAAAASTADAAAPAEEAPKKPVSAAAAAAAAAAAKREGAAAAKGYPAAKKTGKK
mmetsp:Transcript_32693/g.70118  ORF Transcript_32693/g.70118 Transcript_32693/m.70118 type:complete len:741 (-) Transcript_32693:188-2410(-)|eukprot:CAMPEP_0206442636 /NCGR_PEP_ID=MMETSP0324_2-20121206/13929_1 /ASSEMBLY_ACC=CAM_ASM_000836 /TAXON_ID=2866 /ORGANISM="Crypthecodinium cohnii, Strain Seligo" /LENGTH=740 /DNA_ID=CAMNT_0053910495 /DNA_START=114 /DNA_END=2336 /DNA_ORIENTATION=-